MICNMPLTNTEFLDVKGCLRGSLWGGPAVAFSAAQHAILWETVEKEAAIHLCPITCLFFVLLI